MLKTSTVSLRRVEKKVTPFQRNVLPIFEDDLIGLMWLPKRLEQVNMLIM
jgi:hypothetical protein